MLNTTRLAYPSHVFIRNCFRITTTTDPFQIINANPRRVFLSINSIGPIVSANPLILGGQTGDQGTVLSKNANGDFEMYWEYHKILCGLEIIMQGYGIGSVFSVTEVYYNIMQSGVTYNGTRVSEKSGVSIKHLTKGIRRSSYLPKS